MASHSERPNTAAAALMPNPAEIRATTWQRRPARSSDQRACLAGAQKTQIRKGARLDESRAPGRPDRRLFALRADQAYSLSVIRFRADLLRYRRVCAWRLSSADVACCAHIGHFWRCPRRAPPQTFAPAAGEVSDDSGAVCGCRRDSAVSLALLGRSLESLRLRASCARIRRSCFGSVANSSRCRVWG